MPGPQDLAARVAALEAAVTRLQTGATGPLGDLRSEAPEGGGVRFEGSVDLPGRTRVDWQMGHPAQGLLTA
ncbi:hypothetical protein, partial [Pararhodobacter sp. SW119]|uniref:hypothetical protein n=1 Tax=Pararhodobacter sp. SW119 TaxID=2780075 RepID=UPI001ADEE7C8